MNIKSDNLPCQSLKPYCACRKFEHMTYIQTKKNVYLYCLKTDLILQHKHFHFYQSNFSMISFTLCVPLPLCQSALAGGWVSMRAVAFAYIDTHICVWAKHLCALVRQAEIKRGCTSNCDCGVTHSCTAGRAFSAETCHTASRWHSWRKNPAPDNDYCGCFCIFFLWPPCLSLFAALSLGSYPAEEEET